MPTAYAKFKTFFYITIEINNCIKGCLNWSLHIKYQTTRNIKLSPSVSCKFSWESLSLSGLWLIAVSICIKPLISPLLISFTIQCARRCLVAKQIIIHIKLIFLTYHNILYILSCLHDLPQLSQLAYISFVTQPWHYSSLLALSTKTYTE